MNNTGQLAKFSADLQFDDLPANVVEKAKLLTLNIIGKAIAGAQTSLAPKYLQVGSEIGKADLTPVLGGAGLSAPAATYVNSSYATALDYDDTLHWALIHPGNAGVAAGLAIGERERSSGKNFLTALTLAYEIGGRVALSTQPTPERFKMVWGLGNQAFASAPVAAKLLGHNVDQMISTLGITGVYSAVPSAWKYLGPGTRPMREVKMAWGWSAMVGVTSAIAAKSGLTMLQADGIFDGEESYYIMHGSDKYEPEKLVEGLGSRWDILGAAFKGYSACYLIFGVCDAVKAALGEKRVDIAQIDRVVVKGGEWITKRLSDPSPVGPVDAQFSTQWCVAMVLLDREPGPDWCSEEILGASDALDLAGKVQLEFDPVADQMWLENGKSLNEVKIFLKSGECLSGAVDEPKGEPGNPFTDEEIRETYRRLAGAALPAGKVSEIEHRIDDLEKEEDIGAIVRLTA